MKKKWYILAYRCKNSRYKGTNFRQLPGERIVENSTRWLECYFSNRLCLCPRYDTIRYQVSRRSVSRATEFIHRFVKLLGIRAQLLESTARSFDVCDCPTALREQSSAANSKVCDFVIFVLTFRLWCTLARNHQYTKRDIRCD